MSKNTEVKDKTSGSDALVMKWGHEVFDDGIMNMPSCVAMYGRRFLNGGEFSFITCLMAYKYTADNPFPSQQTIAKNMDVSIKTVENWVDTLFNEKQLLEIYHRYDDKGHRTSNEYNFAPLLNKCLEVARKEKAEKEDSKRKKREPKKKGKKQTTPKKIGLDTTPKNIGVDTPKNIGLDAPKNIGLDTPKELGSNKGIESSTLNKGIMNNLSIAPEEIENADLPVTTRKLLLKKIDRLIGNNISISDLLDNYELHKEFVNVAQYNSALKYALNLKNFTDSFEDVMATNVNNQLEFANQKANNKSERKIVRKEMVPEFLNEDSKKEEEPASEKLLLEMALMKMEDHPNQLTEEDITLLKKRGLWKDPVSEDQLLKVAKFKLKHQPENLTEQEKDLLKQHGLYKEPVIA